MAQRRPKLYCGMNQPLPPNYDDYGTRLQCFRKGVAVGRVIAQELTRQQTRTATQRTEALTRLLLARQIQTGGLNVLRRQLRIGDLPLGTLKALAQRLTGTAQAIPRYGFMTRQDLIRELSQRGFRV